MARKGKKKSHKSGSGNSRRGRPGSDKVHPKNSNGCCIATSAVHLGDSNHSSSSNNRGRNGVANGNNNCHRQQNDATPIANRDSEAEAERLIGAIARAVESSSSPLVQQDRRRTRSGLSSVPQSTLTDRLVNPVRKALERIDARKLLHLEVVPPPKEAGEGRDASVAAGPRLKDG